MKPRSFFYHIAPLYFLLMINCFEAAGQGDIPIGTWRMHVSYRQALDVTLSNTKVFCAAQNGLFFLNKNDNSVTTLTKIDGLNDTDISEIAYDLNSQTLLVGYRNGNLDILTGTSISNYTVIKDANYVEKSINHILYEGDLAYISTDFGVVIFDLLEQTAREAYLNLGENGELLKINNAEILRDTLFLATEEGVIAGSLDGTTNLLDFNNWFRFNLGLGIPQTPTIGLAAFDNTLFAAISEDGVYAYKNGFWSKDDSLQNQILNNISSNDTWLTVSTYEDVWMYENGIFEIKYSQQVEIPKIAILDTENSIWIADNMQGLVSDFSGQPEVILPTGPYSDDFFKMFYANNKMIGVSGGYRENRIPIGNINGFYSFENGFWSNYYFPNFDVSNDLVDIAFNPQTQQYLITSFGDGFTVWDGVSETSSSNGEDGTYPFNTDKIAAAHYEEGMWISAYEESIYFQSEAGDWEQKDFGLVGDDEILEITSDNDGQLWFRVDPQGNGGIIVYSTSLDASVRLDNSVDKGGLPSRAVNDIEVDVEGNVWVGTDEGVAYFPRGIFLFDRPVNAIKPILDGRFLLSNEEVSAIESDGGNRKWMGTENGAWLFNEFGDELLEHFTIENSPLLSNQIIDIEIQDQTGELFISTNLGLASYRTGSTKGSLVHETKIKIFPNPVTPDFSGIVGMEGLAYNSEIKITDVSGNLVWQTTSNGGSATWNLQTLQGGRPPSGIYLIFSSLPDGSDSLVGKIAIID